MENKPEYKISASEKDGILEIVLTGEVTKDTIRKLQNEIVDMEILRKIRNVLIDVRELKGRYRYTEGFFRVRDNPSDRPKIKTAIVDSPGNADFENFHEMIASNIGLSLKWFTDVDEARNWLKELSGK